MITLSSYSSELLFHFDSIIDLDLAVLKFIKKNFSNAKYLDLDILKNNDENFFKALLLTRETSNPLSLVLNSQYQNSADSILNEIYEMHYEDIIAMGTPLAPNNILCNGANNDFIHCFVVCKNKAEKLYIKNLSSKIKIIEPKDVAIKNYTAIYVKDLQDLIQYGEGLVVKSIYILNYPFNLEPNYDGILKLDVMAKLPIANKFILIDPYINFNKPI